MSEPTTGLRVHSLWAATVLVIVLVCIDGTTATVAAAGLLSVLGGIAGYGYGRFR